MASPFQRYQSGIDASTGNLVQAYGNMAGQTANAIAGLGQNLAQGLQQYNENSQKSEAANAKIQMLGQEYADKIAMYAKDPEIAQSGILDGLMAKAAILQDAPTKGLSQRVMIAHDAETSLAGFGAKLQEWSFLRGREMERLADEGLRKFDGVVSVTDPRFAKEGEFQFDPNKTLEENKADALAKLNAIRKSNPKMQGTDEEFLANWLNNTEQTVSKADPSAIPPAVTSAILEQIQAEKRNRKRDALVAKASAEGRGMTMEEALAYYGKGEDVIADSDKTKYHAATDVLPMPEIDAKKQERVELAKKKKNATKEQIAEIDKKIKELDAEIEQGDTATRSPILKGLVNLEEWSRGVMDIPIEQSLRNLVLANKGKKDFKLTENFLGWNYNQIAGMADPAKSYTSGNQNGIIDNISNTLLKVPFVNAGVQSLANIKGYHPFFGMPSVVNSLTENEDRMIKAFMEKKAKERKESENYYLGTANIPIKKSASERKANLVSSKQRMEADLASGTLVDEATGKKLNLNEEPKKPTVSPLSLGEQVVGSEEQAYRKTVQERQREVADFITSRMGAIDPTDPERKRRLPVAGFDKFYKSLVPEAEIREFTTPSGVRMLYANGKWEQMKAAEPMTLQDIRKSRVGIYGQQNAQGGFTPTEFVPDSGVYIGGIFNGGDAANDKYSDEMTQLIDARRSVKELQRINDLVGEAVMPVEKGRALVEQMNLSAMLRTDIVGVGTVSNYEQQLIAKVIKDPTAFFSFESQDRAILVALAQRVDRRIKAISAAKGLTVKIRDDSGTNKYQALREQYLKEKGLL